MKILLLGNYPFDYSFSMFHFANILQKELLLLGHDVRSINPEPFFGRISPNPSSAGKWLGYMDKYSVFPRRLDGNKIWADIVHILDHSNAVYLEYLRNIPATVTCHDLIAIRSALGELKERRTGLPGRMLQRNILKNLNKAPHIACVSETTINDLMRVSSVKRENISLVYNGLNYPYSPMPEKEASISLEKLGFKPDAPFLIHVGKGFWYKNRLGVLKIFQALTKNFKEYSNFHLVMVGDPMTSDLRAFTGKYRLESKVHCFSSVHNENLRALYTKAAFLLFPSLYEGFGWPIIEAQASGCAVVTTDKNPMKEIAGNAAVYINPENIEQSAEIIIKNIKNFSALREMGFMNIKRFSSKKMAAEYVKIYEKLLKG
jgi:glycosyltransferase involved in cell wall biosynthesis